MGNWLKGYEVRAEVLPPKPTKDPRFETFERPIIQRIRLNATGEVRESQETGYFDGFGFQDFIWDEGNFACDCNRHLFFERAGGVEPEFDPDEECSDFKYAVQILDAETREVLYDDFDTPATPR